MIERTAVGGSDVEMNSPETILRLALALVKNCKTKEDAVAELQKIVDRIDKT